MSSGTTATSRAATTAWLSTTTARIAAGVGREADRRATAYRGVSSSVAVEDRGAVALRYTV